MNLFGNKCFQQSFHTSKEYTCSYLVVVKCTLAPTSRDKNKQIEVACGMFVFFWGDSFVFCAGADVFQNGSLQFPTLFFWAEPCFFDPVCMYTEKWL
jgi:hypothetical protein